ncbi:hypothetical protein KCU67_g3747, partial [Aureobasidium melanogenum]
RQYIKTKFERLDVLVSNAAILLDPKVSPEYSLGQAMQDTFATNTSGAADLVEEFIPLLERSQLPRLVFVSSGYASLHRFANFTPSYTTSKFFTPAYACSKAALNMLMLQYNVQYASKGWKINACCPGFTKTNFSNHDEQASPANESALIAVKLATLGEDGETGTFVNINGQIACDWEVAEGYRVNAWDSWHKLAATRKQGEVGSAKTAIDDLHRLLCTLDRSQQIEMPSIPGLARLANNRPENDMKSRKQFKADPTTPDSRPKTKSLRPSGPRQDVNTTREYGSNKIAQRLVYDGNGGDNMSHDATTRTTMDTQIHMSPVRTATVKRNRMTASRKTFKPHTRVFGAEHKILAPGYSPEPSSRTPHLPLFDQEARLEGQYRQEQRSLADGVSYPSGLSASLGSPIEITRCTPNRQPHSTSTHARMEEDSWSKDRDITKTNLSREARKHRLKEAKRLSQVSQGHREETDHQRHRSSKDMLTSSDLTAPLQTFHRKARSNVQLTPTHARIALPREFNFPTAAPFPWDCPQKSPEERSPRRLQQDSLVSAQTTQGNDAVSKSPGETWFEQTRQVFEPSHRDSRNS